MRWLLVVLTLAACRPELPEPPGAAPAAPTLRLPEGPLFLAQTTLGGEAEAGTRVRVFVDDACAGPKFLEVTAVSLGRGVEVRLIDGDNVFTAQAVSSAGVLSACSAPVVVTFAQLGPPSQPELQVLPKEISRFADFTVRGRSDRFTHVHLFDGTICTGPVMGELSAADFAVKGFPVEGVAGDWRTVSVNAINPLGEVSGCTAVWLLWDTTPPEFMRLEVLSPMPTAAWGVTVLADVVSDCVRVFEGPGCSGAVLRDCVAGHFPLELPRRASWAWSAAAKDRAGNVVCLEGPPLEYDADAERPAVELELGRFGLRARVSIDEQSVELFEQEGCRGPPSVTWASGLLLQGVRPQSFAPHTTLSARGVRFDGVRGPCSAPLTLP